MKKLILLLIILPLLISCGIGENMSVLDTEDIDQTDSRRGRGSRGDRSSNKQGKQDKKGGDEKIYFNFRVGETKEHKSLSDIKALVLVSLDASASMLHFLKKAEQPFRNFTPALSPLDWTLIFVRADGNHFLSSKGYPMRLEHNGKELLQKQLTPDMKNHASIFTDTIRRHKQGEYQTSNEAGNSIPECDLPPRCQLGWNEKPMESLYLALMKNNTLIEEADVIISIMISNSDEGIHSKPEDRITAAQVKTAFYKTYNKPWINYGIIMKKGDEKCLNQWSGLSEKNYSVRIAEMAKETGGTNFGLCEESYVPLAKKIVSDIQKLK